MDENRIILGFLLTVVVILTYFTFFAKYTQGFSEIYLIPNSYPKYVNGSGSISFVYGLRNNEAVPREYAVRIFFDGTQIDEKTVNLLPGQQNQDRVDIILPDFNGTATVSISLQNLNQSVFFKIENRAS